MGVTQLDELEPRTGCGSGDWAADLTVGQTGRAASGLPVHVLVRGR